MNTMKLRIALLLLACIFLCACTVQRVELRQVDWTSIKPSEVILKGTLAGQDFPEPALITRLRIWEYGVVKDATDALDEARPVGILLPAATRAEWIEPGKMTDTKDLSFPAATTIDLNIACVGGCQIESHIFWNANRWFSPTKKLAEFNGQLKSGQVVKMRFRTPDEQAVCMTVQLSDCSVPSGKHIYAKCIYALSATIIP
jgi:hypothetical protein